MQTLWSIEDGPGHPRLLGTSGLTIYNDTGRLMFATPGGSWWVAPDRLRAMLERLATVLPCGPWALVPVASVHARLTPPPEAAGTEPEPIAGIIDHGSFVKANEARAQVVHESAALDLIGAVAHLHFRQPPADCDSFAVDVLTVLRAAGLTVTPTEAA